MNAHALPSSRFGKILITFFFFFAVLALFQFGCGRGKEGGSSPRENSTALFLNVQNKIPPYEERFGGPLEDKVKEVDHALIRYLIETGLSPDCLDIADIEIRNHKGQDYHHQAMLLAAPGGDDEFMAGLKKILEPQADDIRFFKSGPQEWRISSLGRFTHKLTFKPFKSEPEPALGIADKPDPAEVVPDPNSTRPLAPGQGLMVVVIDDLGESMRFARALAKLDFPVTFSVWPLSTHAAAVAEIAHEAGLDVIVHQPMEPMDMSSMSPGPGAVYLNMDVQSVMDTVRSNISKVPYALGLNNHMGSRFTQDERVVSAVLRVAAEKGLLVLDSMTHPRSKMYALALSSGMPCLKRDVFLDVVRSKQSIIFQLRKTARMAGRNGLAVAIGHPYPETLAALREWGGKRDRKIKVIGLGRALSNSSGIKAVLDY